MSAFTHKNIRDVEDQAPGFGMGDIGEARFPRDVLGAETTGFAHHVLKPGKRHPFGHRHSAAEEVYVVIAGSGRMRIEGEIIDLARLDAVRVSPSATRGLEAGPDGLEVLVFGPRHEGDGELDHEFWKD